MTPYHRRKNPYIIRMAQDMQIRNLAANTIDSYTWHVDKFCSHFGKMPEELGLEEIRQYQLFLVNEKKSSWSSFNQAVCALRFLYEITLAKPWVIKHIPFGKRPKTLPVVLSDQEASQLLQCTHHLKHRTVLLVCYAAGLRLAEATHLKVADIDGQRGQIRVRCGKGSKERRVPVSPRLLEALREYWKAHRPNNYLFPGKTPDVPLSSATIQRACKMSAAFAAIGKPVSPHTLRHSYATSMLEAGVDLLTISKLLGHSSFITTMIYLHVRRQHFDRSPSPIDWLPVRQCPQWAERNPLEKEAREQDLLPSPTLQDTKPPLTLPASPSNSTSEEVPPAEAKSTRRNSGRKPKRRSRPRRE
jgi:site-specific recombinase XerD